MKLNLEKKNERIYRLSCGIGYGNGDADFMNENLVALIDRARLKNGKLRKFFLPIQWNPFTTTPLSFDSGHTNHNRT